ncbi:hypothetical protein SEA_JACKO_30 [Microbacterium phage Jacko]|nr:hypothetical protein SEA_JACKO_30 [Microbacterium phage Jacko]
MTSFADAPKPKATAEQVVEETYFTSATGRAPEREALTLMADINAAVKQLGLIIEVGLPAGRNKSLAKTALEETQMRAIRSIFSPIG